MIGDLRRVALAALVSCLLLPVAAGARTFIVRAGSSIGAALAQAQRGDRVVVMPGVYHEGVAGGLNALTLTREGIQLIGVPRPGQAVVLENAGGQKHGIWVSPPDSSGPAAEVEDERAPCVLSGAKLSGFLLSGFTVRGFLGHGVHLACIDGFELTNNVSDGNAIYGLFPIFSKNGFVAHNEVLNTGSDAAIYIGQSDSVLISDNTVHDSLLGIEVQNSRHCSVIGNEVYGNTLGILVDVGTDKVRKIQDSTLVSFNRVHDNNRVNTALPGDFIAVLPKGVGILLVGADTTTVSDNRVRRNGSVGIGVVSLCLGLALAGQPCTGLDVDPFPSGNHVVGNFAAENGTVPIGSPQLDPVRSDLFWDGSGSDNCWGSNTATTTAPPGLPPCS